MTTYEEKHYIDNNFKLKEKFGLKAGTLLKLKKDFEGFKKGDIFTIYSIHPGGGWVLINETWKLPQEVKELMKICKLAKKEMLVRSLGEFKW